MSRALSAAAQAGVNTQETSEIYLIILEIDNVDLGAPIRVVNNSEDITSNGDLYSAFNFKINLPPDTDEGVVGTTLVIDNTDRQVVDALRTITSAPTVNLSVILASSPDTIEAGPFPMTVENATYDVATVQFQVAFEDVLNEPFPAHYFIEPTHPALF